MLARCKSTPKLELQLIMMTPAQSIPPSYHSLFPSTHARPLTNTTMADMTKISRPLTRASVREAHDRITPYIHHTPVLQCDYISSLASTPQSPSALNGTEYADQEPARPKMNIFFKCENYQRIGAFKARGAFHALSRLTDAQLEKGVITHSVCARDGRC